MQEHRLIERLSGIMEKELLRIRRGEEPDLRRIDGSIEVNSTYGDLLHYGKEEEILFKRLSEKPLTAEHRALLNELIAEHELSRNLAGNLIGARKKFAAGDRNAAKDIAAALEKLVQLHRSHIEKEDKHFFFPSLEYFNREERDIMLREGVEFDHRVVHEKYQRLVEELEKAAEE